MDEDTRDHYHELEEMVRQLIERSIGRGGSGIPPVYGFHIIIVGGELPIEGIPYPHPGGDMTLEPPTEVAIHDGEVLVVTELPGVEDEYLHLQVTGTTLRIKARGDGCDYETAVNLPPVDTGSMSHHLKNGVLEVRFRTEKEQAVQGGDHPAP
ncbi:MAG: hypothetical protein LUO82_03390 [Methanomicrobiales archaeon]|nr:hypothetical protein [Methanomicrobiales archaeon]